ncbi:hypothetical protein LKO27_02075 [Tessaracoccus sp. OS52]|uniref:hypothetical protein n=1 Tax=Tessaracoccus sp. OS52 TaxID=2886691 RepID=UPI001D101C52|nr:hypothetical protein [Tessaracoccus sp. OS52]MCC2592210.1 hypothetical protein [Tessaracoccus sp. OS52]
MTTNYEILPQGLVSHARLRGGVFTSAHAQKFGIQQFSGAIARGECHRQRPGLYSLAAELDTAGKVWAGLLIAGPSAALGLAAAAWVRGQGPEPEFIDVWTGYRKLSDRGPWRFHPGSPEDTQSTDAVNDAFGRLLVSPAPDTSLAQKLAGRALRLQDRERFLWLCEEGSAADGISAFESRLNRDVLLPHGLPFLDWENFPDGKPHDVQALLRGVDVNIRFDGSIPREDNRHQWLRSLSSSEDPADPGKPLVLSWGDVVDLPCRVAGLLARRLRARTWRGELLDCTKCSPQVSMYSRTGHGDERSLTECPSCGSRLVQLWRLPEPRDVFS